MKLWSNSAAALLIACALLAACGGGGADEAAPQDPTEAAVPAAPATDVGEEAAQGDAAEAAATACAEGEPVPVTFGTVSVGSSIGLMTDVIEEEGLDTRHGIDLQPREFTPAQAEQALLTGQVETGFLPLLTWVKVQAEGNDVVLLSPLQSNHGALIVPAESEYQTIEDLTGQKIATLDPVSGMYTGMQLLATAEGLDWPGDFEVIGGPPPALVTFLESGEVEGIIHFEPTVSRLLSTGEYREVVGLNEAYQEATGDPLLMLGLATSGSWLEENSQAAPCLVEVFKEATTLLAEDPDLIAENYGRDAEELGLSEEAVQTAQERMSGIYISEEEFDGAEEKVRTQYERAAELGIIPTVPDEIFTHTS